MCNARFKVFVEEEAIAVEEYVANSNNFRVVLEELMKFHLNSSRDEIPTSSSECASPEEQVHLGSLFLGETRLRFALLG